MGVNDVYKASAIFTAPDADGEMVMTFHYRTVVSNPGTNPVNEAGHIAGQLVAGMEANYY